MTAATDSSRSTFRAEAGFEQERPLPIGTSGHRRSKPPSESRQGPKRQRRGGPPNPRLLSIRDAATYMACSEWVMRSLIDKGELPHLKVGKKLRVDRGDLDTFIDLHRITNYSAPNHRGFRPKLVSSGA